MKRVDVRWLRAMAVLAMALLVGCTVCGCRHTDPAAIPSDQKGAPFVIGADSRAVLEAGIGADAQVLASALESSPESGSVIYVDHKGYVYDPAGNVVFDPKTGLPLKMSTKIVAKLNSMQAFRELGGATEVDYEVGGRSYLVDLPDNLKHLDQCPVPLRLRIKGLNTASISSPVPEAREAAAKEREAIFNGMAKLAEAKGAAFAVKVQALADGTVKVVTAAGKEIIGRCLGTAPIEAGIAGATKIVEARIAKANGVTEAVVAEGDASAALVAAAPPAQ